MTGVSGRRPPARLLAACLPIAALALLPAAVVLAQAGTLSPDDMVALLFRPLVGQLLLNTLGLTVAAALLCGAIGTAAAWGIERTRFPGRGGFAVLAAVPLAV